LLGDLGVFVQGGIEEALVGERMTIRVKGEERFLLSANPSKVGASRRTKNVRRKKPGRCVRDDGLWVRWALCRT